MKKKRLSKRLKVALLVLLGSTPFACCFLCCFPWPIKEQKTVGVRKDAQRIVVQGSRTVFDRNRGEWRYKWFLEEPGKPRREMAFLVYPNVYFSDSCWPVDESSVWVHFKRNNPVSPTHTVLVFNDAQILHRGELTCEYELEGTHDRYKFANGNQTIVYRRTKEGYDAYDVTTGTVTDWKPAEK